MVTGTAERWLPEDASRRRFSTGVRLGEVLGSGGLRIEGSYFGIEARQALEELKASGLPLIALLGENGLCPHAHNAFRFKRVYVGPEHGVPFLSSSDIIGLRPETGRYISRKLTKKLDELLVRPWDVLISRSGTIGNVGLASQTFVGKALSEDVIRLTAQDPNTAGYVAAFLRGRYGRLQLIQATYGSVVQHIEPEHLRKVLIPDLPPLRRSHIGSKMVRAGQLRDRANELLDAADALLYESLQLPPLESLVEKPKGHVSTRVRASQLSWRFEASYHDPLARRAEEFLRGLPLEVTTLGDPRVTREIRPITRFRKRVYVREGGIPMLTGKQLFQIDPIEVKGLAKGAHTDDMPEIALTENMLIVTCGGTIGKVQIIPAYMKGWASTQDSIRVLAAETMNPGYLYAWLASAYGKTFTKRHAYGSVILKIDKAMLAAVPVPLPNGAAQHAIGDKVLQANQLRSEAWDLEREAIGEVEGVVGKSHKLRSGHSWN
uniref:Type I restriction enzyme, S subunit n=1 Tax=Candidatus Kentrum eta TaxID=2126337 RepID=A0A450USP5_9GAMM|nr:MAG: type I restriction enzyme, S subunit [Candidatus Kentron sp. H]VFJ95558.1 MAG: type I restriction enzyme, S subunit [Candidatus Kentron sp. H]VFK01782.1 MAG: type I restriction enzyme, S subunit [Candidatus Kentron sp. H]